jgi:taurine dioxygenase
MVSLAVSGLHPFGAEVDYDMRRPLDQEGRGALREHLYRHKLLVFRGQQLDAEDQLRIMGYLGVVLPPEKEHRELALDGDFGRSRIAYHADLIFTPKPYERLSLYAIEVEDDATTTRFVDATRAASRLPEALRRRVEALTAVNVTPLVQTHREIDYAFDERFTHHTRPVIVRHPVTGEPVLYVTEMQTAKICELPRAQSDDLLAELFGHLYAKDAVCEHSWRKGDLVIWDNIALQHGRDDQAQVSVRRLRRVIGAEQSFYELCPEFMMGDPRINAWGEGGKYQA